MGLSRAGMARFLVEPREWWLAGAALLASLVVVVTWNAQGTGGSLKDYLFFFWLPQLVLVSVLVLVFRARPATAAGASLALSCYLVAFIAWQRHIEDPSGMAWLGYFFSLPGGIVGALAARGIDRRVATPRSAVILSLVLTLLGIAVNQAGLCFGGLMSCRV